MKLKHVPAKMCLFSMMSLGLAQGAYADLEATKLGSLADSITIHSSVYLQHYIESIRENDEHKNRPRARIKPLVGAKFFDDTLDAYFIGYLDHMPETTSFESHQQTRFYLEAEGWKVADILSIQPWLRHDIAQQIQDEYKEGRTIVASTQTLSSEFSTGIGAITPSLGVELAATFFNRPVDTTYNVEGTDPAGLGLTASDDFYIETDTKGNQSVKGKRKHADLYHEWFAGINFVPNALPDLTVNATTWYTNNVVPEYTINANKATDHKYIVTKETYERLRIAYQINDNMTLRNDFVAYQRGLFERGVAEKDKSFYNEVGVIYNLF